ncbi:MAG: hypothetical protein AAF756_03365 [Pseudomonadota bacterium]
MTGPFLFAFGTYLAAFACFVFCVREAVLVNFWHGVRQFLIFAVFVLLFWILESWAGEQAPFYDYAPPSPFPHTWPRFEFSTLAPLLSVFGLGSLLDPSALASHPCAVTPEGSIPAAIPFGGGSIAFSLLWTTRYLLGDDRFVRTPFTPIIAPWLVGLMALWLDLALDPVLANTLTCDFPTGESHTGLQLWTWKASEDLGDFWFRIPLYNFVTWFAAPAILTAVVILVTYIFSLITQGVPFLPLDLALRSLILFFVMVIFFASPRSANSVTAVTAMALTVVAIGFFTLTTRWQSFVRDNPWRWELVFIAAFFAVFPPLTVLISSNFRPIFEHLPLLALTVLIGIVSLIFAISPYRRFRSTSGSITRISLSIAGLALLLAFLGNS